MESPAPTLASVVRERTGASWSRAKRLCSDGRVRVNGERCLDPAMRVAPGAVVAVDEHGPRLEKGPLSRAAIVFHDRDLVVVDKPPGMLAVADAPGNKETLAEYARILLQRMEGRGSEPGLGVVHRIDRDTSGLMVFARTADAKRKLAARFRAHDIERIYQAIAHGAVQEAAVETDL
ncbi:MAG TPA: pseudouridine synthase, partial [Usitatibacter sp.]|nr:pseudouridine synthase [Usitatibacter sp.]